ncbi:glycosyltransferase family 2 protein [Spirosoma fluviale]|uniref:Glycosyltransferase involved in cell wall bisynthesis n=1 Tax=Spirosoma fluviale TaxID=1597977 RepID=A0A286FD43_9BACT|nr:glycosyltransferase family 2 protein [Spirosoma fluviale]SOD81148.1 Glycosyltransferase involved in cell wall bisynthesis [Spirosoma fluviale]
MENRINVSVLMAVYNTDFVLVKRAIDSVLNQNFQNFELIIIDDGSLNDPQNRILTYAKQHEDKIVYLRHTNCGQSKSISRGILNSTGEFITILDADDEYKPHHLQACLQEMDHTDLIASTTETVVDTENDYYVSDKQDHTKFIHVDKCILFATLFGRKEVFRTINFLDGYGADARFFERAAQTYRVRKADLRTYIYYRNMPNSICSTLKKKHTLVPALL